MGVKSLLEKPNAILKWYQLKLSKQVVYHNMALPLLESLSKESPSFSRHYLSKKMSLCSTFFASGP